MIQPEPGSEPDRDWMLCCPAYQLLDPRWLLDDAEILESARQQGTWLIEAGPSRYVQAPVGLVGATEYRGVIDADHGIFLALSGWFEGEKFASLELIDLAFDLDLPDETFQLP